MTTATTPTKVPKSDIPQRSAFFIEDLNMTPALGIRLPLTPSRARKNDTQNFFVVRFGHPHFLVK